MLYHNLKTGNFCKLQLCLICVSLALIRHVIWQNASLHNEPIRLLRNEMHFLEFKRCIFHLHLIITSLIYLFNIYMHDLEIARYTVIILVPKIISNIHPVMSIINLYHCHYKKVFLFDLLFAFISYARSFCVHSFYFNRIRLQDTIKLSAINIFVMCFLIMYIY